jgi:nitronate monooxygenase
MSACVLERDEEAKAYYREAAGRGDIEVIPVWASEAIDLITEVVPAAELVRSLAAETEEALLKAGQAVSASDNHSHMARSRDS